MLPTLNHYCPKNVNVGCKKSGTYNTVKIVWKQEKAVYKLILIRPYQNTAAMLAFIVSDER